MNRPLLTAARTAGVLTLAVLLTGSSQSSVFAAESAPAADEGVLEEIEIAVPPRAVPATGASTTLTPEPVAAVAASEPAPEPGLLPERPSYNGVDKDLFSRHSWYTPPPPSARPQPVRAPVERKPVAPPLPYEFMGSYDQGNAPTLYFLVKGDRTYDVRVGDTLDGTYHVDGVSDGQLMFTYLPLKTSQGLRLGD